MGTVETRSSKTLASTPESDKTKSQKEKTLREVSERLGENSEPVVEALAGIGQENGVGDLGVSNITGNEENGGSLPENGDVSDTEDGDLEEKGVEGDEFCVGDFVWGKIKSHPWWPGQVYESSDASEFAAKVRRKGSNHLVAYFGDGTFAWCRPSQLKPFEENFREMSKQSNAKAFVGAVQKAVDEIGRVLELKMTCSCVAEQNRGGLGRSVVENAGVKEGSLVPEGKIRKLSDFLAEPAETLNSLRRIGRGVEETDVVEIRVLRTRVSAFYRSKGVYELPRYSDPVPVPGLEDNEKSTVEVPAQGPFEEWLPSGNVSLAEASQPLLQSCPVSSEGKRTPRRKQRSIADLISKEGASSEKKGSKKRKRGEGKLEEDDGTALTSASGKAKKTKQASGEENEDSKDGVASKGRKKEKKDNATSSVVSEDGVAKPQFEKSPSFRERKKSKYLSPPFTDVKSVGKKKKESGDAGSKLDKDAAKPGLVDETEIVLNQDDQKKADVSTNEVLSEVRSTAANPFTQRVKKSVEMVADFMSVFRGSVYSAGSNNDEVENKSQSRKRKRKTSEPESESGSQGKEQKKAVETRGRKKQETGTTTTETRITPKEKAATVKSPDAKGSSGRKKQKQVIANPEGTVEKSKGIEAEVKSPSEVKSRGKKKRTQETATPDNTEKSKGKEAAVKPREVKSPGRKKRKQETVTPGETVKKSKEKEAKKQETVTPEETVEKSKGKEAKSSGRKKRKQETAAPETIEEEKVLPATLIVEFAPASTLPTKADLIRMYGKYGELDEVKTDMYYNNQCARVYFLNESNAESAYKDSKTSSPFGSTSVEFVLECPSREYKTRVLDEISGKKAVKSPKKSPAKSKSKENSGGESSELGFVKSKLEVISSMLDEKEGKMSLSMKSKLKGEISGLLEKVNTMVG